MSRSSTGHPLRHISILGSSVDLPSMDDVLSSIGGWIENPDGECHRVVVTGFHGLWAASRDASLHDVLNSADLWVPDGIAPVWIARLHGFRHVVRTPGAEVMRAVFEQGRSRGYRHYFYGGSEGVLRALRSTVEAKWPGNVVAGSMSPPFRKLASEEIDAHIEAINDAKPDILWVALGMPKQDLWIHEHRHRLKVPVATGVGAAFAFVAGTVARAPAWIGRAGLEWAYRFMKEPRKCWHRVCVEEPQFVAAVLREEFFGARAKRIARYAGCVRAPLGGARQPDGKRRSGEELPSASDAASAPPTASRRVLFLAVNCFPASSPEAIVNAKLVRALLRAGWSVDVVTRDNRATAAYPEPSKAAWSSVAAVTRYVPCLPRGIERPGARLPIRLLFSLSRVLSNLSWALAAYRIGLSLVRKNRPDLILSRSVPASAHLAAALIAPHTNAPWVANWNDPEPWKMAPPPYGRGAGASPGPLWSALLKFIVRRVTWATFPCARLRDYMCRYLPDDLLGRSSVIPHIGTEVARSGVAPEPEIFSILHAGSLDEDRSPDVFLEGVSLFLERRDAIQCLSVRFMGGGADLVNESASRLGLKVVVRVEATRSYAESIEAMRSCTVLLLIEAALDEGIFLPSKLLDYAGVGRPILGVTPHSGTVADVLEEHGGGLAADNRSAKAVSDALCELFDAWRSGELERCYVSRSLQDAYREASIVEQYARLEVMLKLAGGRGLTAPVAADERPRVPMSLGMRSPGMTGER